MKSDSQSWLIPGVERSRSEIEWGMRCAAMVAGLRVGINDAPALELNDLLTRIAVESQPLHASWKLLRAKYDAWIAFHAGIEEGGSDNPAADSERHARVNSELEEARNAFVGMLRAPPRLT